jgi:NDP-sugar pyrophosphorylase family protein
MVGDSSLISSAVIIATSTQNLLTEQRPRAMLPVLGKPMVVRVMDRFYKAGIRHFIVIVGISEGAVAAYLNKQWMPDAQIEFVLKANESLGQLLIRIATQLSHPFVVSSYNSFTHEHFIHSLSKIAGESPDALVIGAARSTVTTSGATHFAPFQHDGVLKITTTREENSLIAAEQAVFGQATLGMLKSMDDKVSSPATKTLLDVFQVLTAQNNVPVRIVEAAWLLCIENESDLLILNKRMLDESTDAHILSELPYTVKVIPPIRIDPQVSVGQGAVIGPYVYIERGSSIGYGAKIKNSIVLERGNVPADANLSGCIVTTRGTVIV